MENSTTAQAEPERDLVKTTSAEVRASADLKKAPRRRRVMSPGTYGDVPPSEDPPERRSEPTVSPVVEEPDEEEDEDEGTSANKVPQPDEFFEDLLAHYPLRGGQYWYRVERLEPKIWKGIPVRGVLKPIEDPIDWPTFIGIYGGTKYGITVYGTLKRNGKQKRYTKPIIVHVPDYNPNLSATPDAKTPGEKNDQQDDQENGSTMLSQRASTPGASNADARIMETQFSHEERLEDRRERQREQMEQRTAQRERAARAEEQAKANAAFEVLKMELEAKTAQVDRLETKYDKLIAERDKQRDEDRKERERERAEWEKERNKGMDAEAMSKLISASRPSAEEAKALQELTTKLSEQHRSEVERLTTKHSEEMQRTTDKHNEEMRRTIEKHNEESRRLTESYTAEINRLRDRAQDEVRRFDTQLAEERRAADARIQKAESSADTRVRDVEDRSRDRIKEVEERSKQEISTERRSAQTRIDDLTRQNQTRVEDLVRGHDREMKSVRDRYEMQLTNERGSSQARLDLKDQEIARLSAELEDAREELRKPLTERINEAASAAEALGYIKDGPEEKDWKQIALEIGGNLVTNLPEVFRAAGDSIGRIRNQPNPQQMATYAQPPPAPRPALQPAFAGPGGFATDDGPEYEGAGAAPPVMPGAIAPTVASAPPTPAPTRPPAPAPAAVPPQRRPPMRRATPSAAPPPAPPPPAATPPAPAAQPNPAALAPASAIPTTANANGVPDHQLLQFQPLFESALKQGASPEEFADHCMTQFGLQNIVAITQLVSPERVIATLQRSGQASSPLCRRDGQKFLRETFVLLRRRVTRDAGA